VTLDDSGERGSAKTKKKKATLDKAEAQNIE